MKNIYILALGYLGLGLMTVTIISYTMAKQGVTKPVAYLVIGVVGIVTGLVFYFTHKEIKSK